jgi:hypothetical protein
MGTLMVSCPGCNHQFEPGGAFMKDFEHQARQKMAAEWHKMKAELDKDKHAIETQRQSLLEQQQQQEREIQQRLILERQKMQQQLQESIRRSVASDFENQLKLLQQAYNDKEEKLKLARQKELDFLQKEQRLSQKEEEMEIELQKRINDEREKLSKEIRDLENQKLQQQETEWKLKLAEKEKQLDEQKRLAEEMRKKAEQGSTQLQGEVQELLLEDLLRIGFPVDKVVPVGKGIRGADCLQIICNPYGNECGKIIYESKRTASFSNEWIDKLKADMRSQGADIAVIVTQTLPKDMERFGEKEGVYICSFAEVRSLATVLRTSILKVFQITKSQEKKGDKMNLLYDYLTSNEFAEQWNAIREGFTSMRLSIQRERETMERLWKSREKQLEKVLLNASHIRGSIEGIAGADAVNMELLEENQALLID